MRWHPIHFGRIVNKPCEPLPIVRVNQKPDTESDCSRELTSRKMYAEVAPAVVKVSQTLASGSGFFVGDGSRVITNAHVVDGVYDLLTIETYDHHTFKARIEKLDDVNDLAVLRLEDGARWTSSLQLGSSDRLKQGDPLFGVGHPLGMNDTYISPGHFTVRGPFNAVFGALDPTDEDWQKFLALTHDSNPDVARDAVGIVNSPRVESELQTEHGNSGGPVINSRGEVVSVTQFGSEQQQYHKFDWSVPAEQVQELLDGKNDKFQFDYGKVSMIQQHPLSGALLCLGMVGLTARFPRVAGTVLGAFSADQLYNIVEGAEPAVKDGYDQVYRGLEWTADASLIGGAALSWIPKLRTYGWWGLGIGVAATVAEVVIPHDLGLKDIKRKDGTSRLPMLWSD